MIKISILLFKKVELLLILLEKVDLLFEMRNYELFLVGLDLQWRVIVSGTGLRVAHVFLVIKRINLFGKIYFQNLYRYRKL